jgi:hypothetical protein
MKKWITIITIIVVIALVIVGINIFKDKDFSWGKKGKPKTYSVSSIEDFEKIKDDLSGHYKQTKDLDFSGYEDWETIGVFKEFENKKNKAFTGVYDGDGYIIKNFEINNPSEDSVSIFAYLDDGAVIKNLKLENIKFTGNKRVGGLAAYMNDAVIENIEFQGELEGKINVGGILGSQNVKARVKNTTVNASITGYERVGGIVGLNAGKIEKSESFGKVNGEIYVGGIAGVNLRSGGEIINSNSQSKIHGRLMTGGLAGENSGKIEDSFSEAEIEGYNYSGGISGINFGEINNIESSAIVNSSYETGGISGYNYPKAIIKKSEFNGVVNGKVGAGGISGSNAGKIDDVLVEGEIKGQNFFAKYIGLNSVEGEYDIEEKGPNVVGKDYSKTKLKDYKTRLYNNSELWGLGKIKKYLSNDIDIDWYEDQASTGEYKDMNCVPSSLAMAINWHNEKIVTNGEEVRNNYIEKYNLKGGWNFLAAKNYLKDKEVPFKYFEGNENMESNIISWLDQGNIFIIITMMDKISVNIGNFLRTGSHSVKVNDIGHSFIIKGYLINEEDDLYFEVYDPSSLEQKYLDGNFIGKNRYYLADEVINSMGEDNPYPYIMIQK